MKKIIKKFIEEKSLIKKNDKIIVAISGGADSVFLFHILRDLEEEYNLEIILAHINHNLRDSAIRDENFVKELGEKYKIKTYVLSADIKGYSKKKKIGLEEAGREVRYSYFSEIKKKENADKVALAHNLDDNVETFLFRMMRGTSLKGLKGIPIKREFYIRPLLKIYKKDIIDYLEEKNYNFVEDESNKKDIYTRNKIRLNLIPYIEENFNIKFKEKIISLIDEVNENEEGKEINNESIDKEKIFINQISNLNKERKKRYIADFLIKNNIEINKNKIELIVSLIDKKGFKSIDLNEDYLIKKTYDSLYLDKRKKLTIPNKIKLDFENIIKFGIYEIKAELKNEYNKNNEKTIFIDLKKIEGKDLYIRTRKVGDKIKVSGMNGRKKLKQLFIDLKIEKEKRDFVPIIEVGDEIAAVGDLRVSSDYEADGLSEKIIEITIMEV